MSYKTPEAQRFANVVKQLIADRHVKNVRQLLLALGQTQGLMWKIESGVQSVPRKVIEDMEKKFPNVNKAYILYDEGPPLLDSPGIVPQAAEAPLKKLKVHMIPLVSESAAASFVENCLHQQTKIWHGDTVPFVIDEAEQTDYQHCFAVTVEGDSMAPEIPSGSKVIVQPLPDGLWQHERGEVAISLRSGMFMVKRIVAGEGNALKLVSTNPRYPEELTVQLADVHFMARVIDVSRRVRPFFKRPR